MKKLLAGVVSVASAAAVFAFHGPAQAQDAEPLSVIPVAGYSQCKVGTTNVTLRSLIDSVVTASPPAFDADGDDEEDDVQYQVPTAQERTDLSEGINFVMAGNATSAIAELGAAGYEICKGSLTFTSGGTDLLIYDHEGRSLTSTEGRPMLLLRTNSGTASNAAVFSGPHLTSELRIKDQILDAFQADDYYVRAAVLAGTDRCNQTELAPEIFQGNTEVCDGTYRTSDMAHNVDTDFQVMHDRLRDAFPSSNNVQLHGMSLPGISVSRGDDPDDGDAEHPDDLVTRAHESYARALTDAMAVGGTTTAEQTEIDNLTSCTPYLNTYTDEQALTRDEHCGGLNAQLWSEQNFGDPARWVHIEQSLYIRNNHRAVIGSDTFLESIYAN